FLRRGFVYQPSYAIQPDFLLSALFVRAGRPAYYFGDYFGSAFRRTFVPWVDYRISRGVYDPNYSYYRTSFRRSPDWDRNLRSLYRGRYEGKIPRPPVTLAQQTKAIGTLSAERAGSALVERNINLSKLQSVTVLQSLKKMGTLRVTGLAALAGIKPGAG